MAQQMLSELCYVFGQLDVDNHYHVVLDALTKASSQNAELLKIAEGQLSSWETKSGFYSILLNIACDKTIDVNVRWHSVLYIKNGIDRYWRKSAPNAIANDEKIIFRQKLLTCFNEPVNQIALQFSVIISMIARFDFPNEWPELFTALLNGTQSYNELHQQRALVTMHHVVKALASNCVTITDVHIFQQLTASIFTNIFRLWINYSKLFLEEVTRDCIKSKELLENSLLTLKILRHLVVKGYMDRELSKETEAINFLQLIIQQVGPFLECRSYLKNRGDLLENYEKYLVLLMKVLLGVLENQPFSFVQFIKPTLECCVTFCFNKSFEDRLFEKLIVQFLNLIKDIIQCPKYKVEKGKGLNNDPLTFEAREINVAFFTYPMLREIWEQLLYRYFLLSEHDLATWENNPEEFASDEYEVMGGWFDSGEAWKFSLRPCAENFFITFFHEFRDLLTPVLVEMTENVQNVNSKDLPTILKKDAVYNAVGLAAFYLHDVIDFDNWFTNVLIPELRVKEPGYYIITRRVIWLIGKWVDVKMSPDLRPMFYEVVLQLLNNDENLIVRLAASKALVLEDYEFSTEQFSPFLEKSISALFILLKEVKEGVLKMSVLHVFSSIIKRMGSEVRPYTEALIKYLPQLWDSCGEHNMLRCAIIACFVHLVQSLGTLSELLHPFLLPMIALSTDVSLPPHVYLLEDALELWRAVLDNTSNCGEDLLNLASNMMTLLEYKGESMQTCLDITKAYVILSPEKFLNRYDQILVQTFLSSINDLRTEGVYSLLKVVETVFIAFPENGPVAFQPLLLIVHSLVMESDILRISATICLSLFSRVILHNKSVFGNVLQKRANETQKNVETVLGELLDVWLEKMPFVSPVKKRKLLGLGLTCLLTCNSEVVYDRIGGIFLSVVEVLNLVRTCKSCPSADLLVMSANKVQPQDEETEQDKRKRELSRVDPVYTVVLRDYFYNQVMTLQQCVGAVKFRDLMSTVDVATMQQIEMYLKN